MRFHTLVLAVALVGCGEKTTSFNDTPIAAGSATVTAYGMGCPKCANNITLLLEKVDGVESIDVHMGDGTISLEFGDRHPSEAELAQAIIDAGFTYKGIKEGE